MEAIQREYLSVSETAKMLGVSAATIYRLIEKGKLIASKPIQKHLISRQSIDNLIKSGLPQVSE